MWCLWSAKGGAGCSVVASASAVLASRRQPVLLVDLGGGDIPCVLGVESGAHGVADWLLASNPPVDALARIEVTVADHLDVLFWQGSGIALPSDGAGPSIEMSERYRILGRMLAADHRLVVVDLGDLGRIDDPLDRNSYSRRLVRDAARRSTLVSRLCYSAVSAAVSHPSPDDVVLVVEPGRSLRPVDVQSALGVSRVTTMRWDPSIARAADAGMLSSRLPRPLLRLPTDELTDQMVTVSPDTEVSR